MKYLCRVNNCVRDPIAAHEVERAHKVLHHPVREVVAGMSLKDFPTDSPRHLLQHFSFFSAHNRLENILEPVASSTQLKVATKPKKIVSMSTKSGRLEGWVGVGSKNDGKL